LPRLNLSFIAKTLQSGERGHRSGRRFFKSQVIRFPHESIFRHTGKLGKASVAAFAENFIAGMKLFDLAADRFNPTRDVGSQDLVFRFQKTGAHESDHERVGSEVSPVIRVDGCRLDLDQYFVVLGNGFFHVLKLKDIRRPELRINDGFHEFRPPSNGFDSLNLPPVWRKFQAPSRPFEQDVSAKQRRRLSGCFPGLHRS